MTTSRADQLRLAVARFTNHRGAVVGAGVLVDRTHVLTCAHVVAAAIRSMWRFRTPDRRCTDVER
jgi:hypothetical protein